MQVINGTITTASQPGAPQGIHNVIFQDVTITDQSGQAFTGRIGSKQGYAIGAAVQVTVEQKPGQNGPYNYFKRYNPQYAPQGNQGVPQGTAGGQPVGNAVKNKDELIVRQVVAKVVGRLLATKVVVYTESVWASVGDNLFYWIMTGQDPSKIPTPDSSITTEEPAAQDNPNWVGPNPPEPEGEVPF